MSWIGDKFGKFSDVEGLVLTDDVVSIVLVIQCLVAVPNNTFRDDIISIQCLVLLVRHVSTFTVN